MFARALVLGSSFVCGWSQLAWADGNFSTLSYNVAGLLEPISSSHPAKNTKEISCRIRGYSIVNVQEDFNYHADLYDTCDDHPYRSPTSGGMGIGSGLNTLSYFPFASIDRQRWTACNGVDCLTPKGWTLTRVRLEEGAYLSVYNLHAQAQTETKDLDARRKNILQMLDSIEKESGSDAILVMGDTNTRYTRSGDNIGEFLNHGFHDVWIDRIRGGQVPEKGGATLMNCDIPDQRDCEVVDKFLYRNNAIVQLEPLTFLIDRLSFVNADGEQLSDHYPLIVNWHYQINPQWKTSGLFGGPHGDTFNDLAKLTPASRITSLNIRSGTRLDRLEINRDDGTTLGHGGSGGQNKTFAIARGDFLQSVRLCSTEVKGHTRIGFVEFTTALGQKVSGGTASGTCERFEAPVGYEISGFYGRSGDEVDQLGMIFARRG